MDFRVWLRREGRWAIVSTLLIGTNLWFAAAQASEMMSTICNNEVVSVGDRKGEVLAKCGPPLSKSQAAVSRQESQTTVKSKAGKKSGEKTVAVRQKKVKEKEESWTYKIEGSYRTFVFKEGRLDRIESGRLAD